MNAVFVVLFVASIVGAVIFGKKKKPWFMIPCIIVAIVCFLMFAAAILLITAID